MAETPNSTTQPQDLIDLAQNRLKAQREEEEAQKTKRRDEARGVLKSALPEAAWYALGLDPDQAEPQDSGVLVSGSFSHAGEGWTCEAYASDVQRHGAKLTVDLGNGFSLKENLKTPFYSGDHTYQEENAAAVGSLLASLPTQKALADEKRQAQERNRIDQALSGAASILRTTYSVDYLRRSLTRADGYRDDIPEGTPQRERLEEMISEAEKSASKQEAQAAERDQRADEVLQKVKDVAAEQLAAVEDYDERCRRYAEEKAGAYFFGWMAQEIRYCPGFTAEAISAIAGSANYYGGESGDEYAGAYDAVSQALVQKVVALNVRAAAEHEPGTYLFDRLGYNGTRTPLMIGALLDATEISFPEHDATESMAYHLSVPIGRFYVNVPGVQVGSKAIAERIAEGVPERPLPLDERLGEAGICEEDRELLPHVEREAVHRDAYSFLAGATDHFLPYYDPDIPF